MPDHIQDPSIVLVDELLLASMIASDKFYAFACSHGVDHRFFADRMCQDICLLLTDMVLLSSHSEARQRLLAGKRKGDVQRLLHDRPRYYAEMSEGEDAFLLENMISQDIYRRKIAYNEQIFKDAHLAFTGGQPLDKVFADAQDRISAGAVSSGSDLGAIVDMCRTEKMAEHHPVGIPALDEFVKFYPTHLFLLGGKSSTGKTTLANQMLLHWMESSRHSAMYFSLETKKRRLANRMALHLAYKHMIDRDVALQRLHDVGKRMVVFDDVADLDEICLHIVRRARRDPTFRFVVVDYQQDVEVQGLMNSETERTSRVAVRLHRLAVRHNLLVVLLSQLRKQMGEDSAKRPAPPTLDEFRGAGQTGNKADLAIILWAGKSPRDCDGEVPMFAEVVKQKEGRQGYAALMLSGKDFSFKDPVKAAKAGKEE